MSVTPKPILLAISVLLVVTNILLLRQNLILKAAIAGTPPELTKEGDFLDDFEATQLDDTEVSIILGHSARKRILFFFRTTCRYCEKQMELWKSLNSKVDRTKYRITAVTSEKESAGIRIFIASYGIQDWEVLKIRPEEASRARFGSTPLTVVIDQNGLVERSWSGLWSEDQISAIDDYFAINLLGSG